MANRAYLVNHAESEPVTLENPKGEWHLGANYQLPVLWLSLFTVDNLTDADVTVEDDEGNESTAKVSCFMSSVKTAKETYHSRKQRIAQILPESCHQYIEEWEAYLDQKFSGPNIQIEMSELWMMFEPDEFRPFLQRLQEAFESDLHEDWEELLNQANVQDSDVAKYGIRGYDWDCEMGWL